MRERAKLVFSTGVWGHAPQGNFGFLNPLRCNFLISDSTFYISLAAKQKTMYTLKWSQNIVLFFEFISNKKSEIKSSNSFTQRLTYASIFSTTKYYTNISLMLQAEIAHSVKKLFPPLSATCMRYLNTLSVQNLSVRFNERYLECSR